MPRRNRSNLLRETRKKELLQYIQNNPKATIPQVQKAGFAGSLNEFFRGRIKDARKAAGVLQSSRRREYKRALSGEDEDYLILLYNCNFSRSYLTKEFGISNATVSNILKRVIIEGKDVIDDAKERFKYAVETYSYCKSQKLTEKDERILDKIKECIISPLVKDVTSISLREIIEQTDPYEKLLNRVFGIELPSKSHEAYEISSLVYDLETALKEDPSKFYSEESRKEAIKRIKSRMVNRIKGGEYCFVPLSDEEKKEVEEILGMLSPREEKILRMRYGIGESHAHTLEEIGEDFKFTRNGIRQIEKKALKKLRHPSKSKHLRKYLMSERMRMLKDYPEKIDQLRTELEEKDKKIDELESMLDTALKSLKEHGLKISENGPAYISKHTQILLEKLAIPIDELDLGTRAYNCLKNADVEYLGELVQKTESELLKTKNFGSKSLREIKELLYDMGLVLGTNFKGMIGEQYIVNGNVPDASLQEVLNKDIGELELPPGLVHSLKRERSPKHKIADIVKETESKLLNYLRSNYIYYNKETEAMEKIKNALSEYGLELGMDIKKTPGKFIVLGN